MAPLIGVTFIGEDYTEKRIAYLLNDKIYAIYGRDSIVFREIPESQLGKVDITVKFDDEYEAVEFECVGVNGDLAEITLAEFVTKILDEKKRQNKNADER